MAYMAACLLIQQAVIAFPRGDMYFTAADHVVEAVRVNACGIDNIFRCYGSLSCLQNVAFSVFFNLIYFSQELKFHSVVHRIFRQSDGKAKGADNSAGRRVEGCHHGIRYVRLHLPDFISGDYLQPLDPIALPFFQEFFQRRKIVLRKAENERTVSHIIKIQFLRERLHHLASLYIEFRL